MIAFVLNYYSEVFRDFLIGPIHIVITGFVILSTLAALLAGFGRQVLTPLAFRNTVATFGVVALNLLMTPLIFAIGRSMESAYAALGVPSVPASFWAAQPYLVTTLVAIAAHDFADYWLHRFMHTKIGWPIHVMHHSDTHVNGFTTLRIHALEAIAMKFGRIAFLTWIGIPTELVVAAVLFAAIHNAYVHVEIDIDHGPLNWLIASPRFHRWHHADAPHAFGKNLAGVIPLYDILFGTYLKAGPCHEKMGAESDGIPGTDVIALYALPFEMWAKQARAALTGLLGAGRRNNPV